MAKSAALSITLKRIIKMNFDEKITRLKEICRILSGSGVSLEDTAKLYKEGMELSDECLNAISEIREELLKDGDGRNEHDV